MRLYYPHFLNIIFNIIGSIILLVIHMKGQKKRQRFFLHLSMTILVVSTCYMTGCIEDTSEKESSESTADTIVLLNQSLILPDWSDGNYHDYQQTTQLITQFNTDYPNLVEIFSIGKSINGKDIWCVTLTNEQIQTEKHCCVIDGCIHGSEWESCEICLYLAEYLLINFERNHSVRSILNSSIIYLIPILNPDGREQNIRYNENGIDLNRNFAVHFGRILGGSIPLGNPLGFIKIPSIRRPLKGITLTNSGRRPFSEPETTALKEFLDSLDRKTIGFYMNGHTALHFVGSVVNIKQNQEYQITSHQKTVINTALSWCENHTEYASLPIGDYDYYGAGLAHHWVFKEYQIPSFLFELLSHEYEPGLTGGGYHDDLVYWMHESLPILLYLCYNIENLSHWSLPDNEPVLPDGIPPSQV